jgi:hypothetical protein
MRFALAALVLCASPAVYAAADAGLADAALATASTRAGQSSDAGVDREDEAVIRDLELLENLEILEHLEVVDPGAGGR